MRHIDGITVNIKQLTGSKYEEYPNPYEKRHKDFVGSLGSRLVSVPAGDAFEVVVNIDESFKLFRAKGMIIVVVVGGRSSQLSPEDNVQVFWFDRDQMDVWKEPKITSFKTWEEEGAVESTRHVPLEMPRPNPQYATVSADWLISSETYEANPGCISVWVTRGKIDEKNFAGSTATNSITNPPKDFRFLDTGWPKEVNGVWFKGLESLNGREYDFEFVNMAPDAIARGAAEADPDFGHDDQRHFVLSEDDLETESELEFGTVRRSAAWGEEEYQNETDFRAFHFTHTKRAAADFTRSRNFEPSRKKRRTNSVSDGPMAKTTATAAPNDEAGPSTQKQSAYDEQDDDEELPTEAEAQVKEEPASQGGPSRRQEPTPPPDGRSGQNSTIGLSALTPSQGIQAIDLTEDEEKGTRIKEETIDCGASGGSEDDIDYEFQLQKIKIERDYQLEKARIESEKRMSARKNRAERSGGIVAPHSSARE